MRDARTWIARLATVGLCLMGVGCGGGGVPDPSSDPSFVNEAPPPPVSGVAPSTVSAPDPAPAAPAKEAAPQLARNDPAPAPAPAAVEAAAPAAAAPAQAGNDQPAVVATSPAPGEAAAAPGEEKPAPAAKGDASGTTELLNLSNNANNAAPPAEAAKDEVPAATANPGAMPIPGPGGAMPGLNGPPGQGRGLAAEDPRAGGGGGMFGGADNQGANAPANYTYPMTGATTFINAVKSKNKDRIQEATALHAPTEAHSVAMQKLFAQVVDLSISDSQVDDLAKALQGYTIIGMDPAVSSGRQKVVLGKSNGQGGQYRRTLTMRKEAKGWKVCDISGQSEMQGMRGMPMFRGGRRR